MTANGAKTCFVAAPIGDRESTVRERSDRVLDRVIRPAVEPLGFQVARLDRLATPGSLAHQIFGLVFGADLVIADLTGSNPNVLFEVGMRRATGSPLVLVIEEGEHIPFDLADLRTIFLETTSSAGITRAVADVARHVAAACHSDHPSAELLAALLDYDFYTDPSRSGPSGALPAPIRFQSDLRSDNRVHSRLGTLHPPRWTKLDLVRERLDTPAVPAETSTELPAAA